jgi:glycosyltransferase involved in cell wall biosynthesis
VRILFATPFLPYPPIDGGRIIPYHHLRGLAERGHRLTMVFAMRRPEDRANLPELARFGDVLPVEVAPRGALGAAAAALRRGESVRVRRHAFPEVAEELARHAAAADVVYLESLFTAYALPRIRRAHADARIALFEQNVESQIFRRLAARSGPLWKVLAAWETPCIERAERDAALAADAVLTISDDDSDTLRRLAPGADVRTLGAGVDTFPGETIPPPRDPRTVLFLGSYHWPPNRDGARWLAREVWPNVRALAPGARLVVAGNDPAGRMHELADPGAGIEVRGFVQDVVATTREAAVCVVPLRWSGGVRLKVLEAFANERPVVATEAGIAGMPFRDGEEVLVRDGAAAFAEAVVGLLADPAESSRLARNGRARVEAEFSWDAVAGRLVAIFEEMIRG